MLNQMEEEGLQGEVLTRFGGVTSASQFFEDLVSVFVFVLFL